MSNITSLIIKPTSACNFNCSFCSARLLNIPIHSKVPDKLKTYILENKPVDIIITGGEPLINPRSYFEDLFNILDKTNVEYNVSLTSNLGIWYENPEKWDWLFTNPRVGIETSFQYGNERKDSSIYTEERFKELFNKFYERYNIKLDFISVLNKDNAKYAIKTVELAKELGVWVKLNSQIPVGKSTEYFPKYKLLEIYLELCKLGLDKHEANLYRRHEHLCETFITSYKQCETISVAYINEKEELILDHCEECSSSQGKFNVKKGYLFNKCLLCPMCNLCNGCSVNRECLESIKDEHCKWMKEHYQELKEADLL